MRGLDAALARVGPLDEAAMTGARTHLDNLTKPRGSLGRLEDLAVQLAGITGQRAPSFPRRIVVVVAADHGVTAQGVSAYPGAVTAQMVANFVAGGAAVNVLARLAGAEVLVVDAGVATTIPAPRATDGGGGKLLSRRIRAGTADMSIGPAMTRTQAESAIDVGVRLAGELAADGASVVAVGEMGIGNTTAASAITATLLEMPPREVTGRGTGIDGPGLARKVEVIERSIAVNGPDRGDPVGVLAAIGGLEIATLVGLVIGVAAERIPVVLDGFITAAAALVAASLCPALPSRLIASHRSPEPGHARVLERLELRPLLDLELRLGEGSGAVLALGLLDAACSLRDDMATFASAAVAGPRA